jgi:hypothetical protein
MKVMSTYCPIQVNLVVQINQLATDTVAAAPPPPPVAAASTRSDPQALTARDLGCGIQATEPKGLKDANWAWREVHYSQPPPPPSPCTATSARIRGPEAPQDRPPPVTHVIPIILYPTLTARVAAQPARPLKHPPSKSLPKPTPAALTFPHTHTLKPAQLSR